MISTRTKAREIFLNALEAKDCARYLDEACAQDAGLRTHVEELLSSHSRAGDFLTPPDVLHQSKEPPSAPEGPGTLVGRYKLLELIGEGGFGDVYMAEQTEPVRRKVALKIIKLGMDTRQVIARFEAERQALALMVHPNIATILDAGIVSPVCRIGPDAPDSMLFVFRK